MLEVNNVKKAFYKSGVAIEVLDGVTMSVTNGEFVVIQGSNGCGKTTLLHIIGSLLAPDQGEVKLNGENPYLISQGKRARFRSQTIGFVFQQFHLLPYLSVEDNILLPTLAVLTTEAKEQSLKLIKQFGLENRINHMPAELSVGERQRTALARAMLHNPDFLLADEPTGNLDDENSKIILEAFSDYANSGKIIIMVSHDYKVIEYYHKAFDLVDGKLSEHTG